jgi:phosphoglycolate phosphatase-like HAD superfamily hydrolase
MLYLFDIDGTLLLSGGAGSRALDRVFLARYGIETAMAEVDLGGKTDPWILTDVISRRLGRPPHAGELDEVLAAYLPLLQEELQHSKFRLMPWVDEALDWLDEQRGVHLGLATGNVRIGARAKLERAGLWWRFAFGGFGCDSPERPVLVQRAIERGHDRAGARCADREVVVIGDTVHDISAARANGVRVIAVATGSVDRATLAAAEPDAVFDTLEELPAWHLANFG